MRTPSADLLKEQKRYTLDYLVRMTFTFGADEVVLEQDVIRKLNHVEEPWRINAKEVKFDNSDGFFSSKSLMGYKAVIEYGLRTKSGNLYSATSPMWVTWQQAGSVPGELECLLTMLGIPDLMEEETALDDHIPAVDDATYSTWTVKDYLTAIAGATLPCFSHCQAFEILFDDAGDSLLDSYCPKDSARFFEGGTRLDAFRRMMEFCGCACRFGYDGKIHIFVPTITGTDYDSEYDTAEGQHTFFGQYYRETLVMPNYIIVRSQKDDDPQYDGYAVDTDSWSKIPIEKSYRMRLEAGQATPIAQAILARAKLNSEAGVVEVPLNCFTEVYDYVKVNDSEREGVSRTGNVGWLRRMVEPEKGIWNMRFGFGDPPIVRSTREMYRSIQSELGTSFERLFVKDLYVENIHADNLDFAWLDPDGTIDASALGPDFLDNLPDGENFIKARTVHLDASGVFLQENTLYTLRLSGQAAAELYKQTTAPATPTTGMLWIDTSFTPNVVKRWSGSAWQELPAEDVAELERGIFIREVKDVALTADGLVILDEVDNSGEFDLIYKADLSAHHLLLSSVVQNSSYRTTSDAEKSTWNAKAKTYVQASAPTTGLVAGDLWFDSDDGYKAYRWNGSAWVTVQDGEITELRTDIEAGAITLSNLTTISGQWYNKSGLLLSALFGIRLYGGQIALSTHDTYAHALANTGIQCYVGTDGKIYAGAGAVYMDSAGLHIQGQYLELRYSGVAKGYLLGTSYGIQLNADAVASQKLSLSASGTGGIIEFLTNKVDMGSAKSLVLPKGTSNPSNPVEGMVYFNTSDNNMYGYMNGAWQTMHNY